MKTFICLIVVAITFAVLALSSSCVCHSTWFRRCGPELPAGCYRDNVNGRLTWWHDAKGLHAAKLVCEKY